MIGNRISQENRSILLEPAIGGSTEICNAISLLCQAVLLCLLFYAMLCYAIPYLYYTAVKLSSSSEGALSVSLLLYCIKQWDQSSGKSARIVNIGPTILICLIQMAMRSAHGVGISLWKMVAQKRAPNTGGASINNVSSESYSVGCIARDACRIFVCFLRCCESIQSFTRSVHTEVEALPMAASPSGALPQAAPSPLEALPMAASPSGALPQAAPSPRAVVLSAGAFPTCPRPGRRGASREKASITPRIAEGAQRRDNITSKLKAWNATSHVAKLDDLPGPASGGPVGRLDHVRRHVRQRISEVRMLRAEINNLFGVHRYVAIRIIFH